MIPGILWYGMRKKVYYHRFYIWLRVYNHHTELQVSTQECHWC